jgi:hypothetical protein
LFEKQTTNSLDLLTLMWGHVRKNKTQPRFVTLGVGVDTEEQTQHSLDLLTLLSGHMRKSNQQTASICYF